MLVLDTPVATEQYRVEWIRITTPDDVSVIDPTPGPAVTLVGCYPFYHVGLGPEAVHRSRGARGGIGRGQLTFWAGTIRAREAPATIEWNGNGSNGSCSSNPRRCARAGTDAICFCASHRHRDRRLHVQSGRSAIGGGLDLRDDAGVGDLRERRHHAARAASDRAAPQRSSDAVLIINF